MRSRSALAHFTAAAALAAAACAPSLRELDADNQHALARAQATAAAPGTPFTPATIKPAHLQRRSAYVWASPRSISSRSATTRIP